MIARSIYSLFIALASFFVTNVYAQKVDMDKATVDGVEWSEGTITLTDGTVLSGLLKLNTKTGLLAYENGATSKSFTPRSILGFSFFDAIEKKQRNFLSIAYKNNKPKHDGAMAVMRKDRQKTTAETSPPQFFEILVECKTFALVSTNGRLNIEQSAGGYTQDPSGTSGTTVPFYNGPSTTYSHSETLLILTEDGTFEIVLDITNTETDRQLFDSKRNKGKVEESVIEKYTSPYYDQLEDYTKERKLKLKERNDLIKLFEYYKTLSSD